MRGLMRTLITGLVTLIPAAATIYLLYWLGAAAETMLAGLVQASPLTGVYFPGLGVAAGLVIALLVGAMMQNVLARQVIAGVEGVFVRIPVVKSIYGSLRDFMGYFSGSQREELGQVVAVTLGESGIRAVGFLTREAPPRALVGADGEAQVVVYVPLGFQIGGHTLVLPRQYVEPLAMSFEDAMRFSLTAGIGKPGK
ncbi:DUF502 domain-containing protein [Thiohalorhabdus methylotrophus]|uniref:DUF502 domain-containing protein n=1 Tax=Thiohalorhabdus methylotrophus TaxID=3242694 RepID=A0ABV4TX80_9GAMM